MRPAKAFLFHRVNSDGEASVRMYLHVNGKTIRPSLGVFVKPELWDNERRQVRGYSQEVKRMNLTIANKISAANQILSEYELMNTPLTAEIFLKEWRNPGSRSDFIVFFEDNMNRSYERRVIAAATLKQEQMTLRKLKEFSGERIMFASISRAWLEEFDSWHSQRLRAAGYNGARQREKALKHIKKYLNVARATDGLYRFTWPFVGFKWPKHRSTPVFLIEEEIKELSRLYGKGSSDIIYRMTERGRKMGMDDSHLGQYANEDGVERVRRTIRCFLFQCFTGVRYSDLCELTWLNVESDYLVFTPVKTANTSGKEVRQLLTDTVKRYIPGFNGGLKRGPLQPNVVSNQKYNDRLKEMADIANINKRVTSHVGRHTFATYCLKKGVSLPVLQELMGVTKIKTLMVYVHVIQDQKDKELESAFGTF